MFQQLITPVAGSLGWSFLVAVLPVVAVLLSLGVLRLPAWQAASDEPFVDVVELLDQRIDK